MAKEKVQGAIDKYNKGVNAVGGQLSKLDTASSKFRRQRGSIIAAAKGNIFEFPVFVSSSIPMEMATPTNSLLEQVYASYLQMAIVTLNPVIDHNIARAGLQFADLKSDTGRYVEYTDTEWQHDVCHAEYIEEGCTYEFNMITVSNLDNKAIMEYVDHQPLSEFDHFFTEKWDFTKHPARKPDSTNTGNGRKAPVSNGPIEDADEIGVDDDTNSTSTTSKPTPKPTPKPTSKDDNKAELIKREKEIAYKEKEVQDKEQELKDAERELNERKKHLNETIDKLEDIKKQSEHANDAEKKALIRETNALAKEKDNYEKEIKRSKETTDKLKEQIAKEKELIKKERELMRKERAEKSFAVKAPKFISDKEIEKLNTLRPMLMTVDLNVMAEDGHISPVQYVVGAKTHCRVIDADTIPEVAEYPLKEMNKVVRKAKWRAGELKFFSDIVFRIKQKKQTAADSRNPKRKWYRRLYELAHMKGDAPTTDIVKGNSVIASFILDKMGKPRSASGVIPNCTLVISKTDVDICKMKTNIDLLDGNTAAKLCNELFLIGLVVVDTDQESIKMLLPDLHNDFDVHSLASVNRQLAQLDFNAVKQKEVNKFLH